MWQVYLKELLELSRDRKTLIFTVLLPILIMPMIFAGIGWFSFTMHRQEAARVLDYAVINGIMAPAVVAALSETESMRARDTPPPEEIRKLIQQGKLDFVLEIPDEFEIRIEGFEPVALRLHFNDASTTTRVYDRVQKALARTGEEIRAQRLERLGISRAEASGLVDALVLERHNTADLREDVGEKIGGFLPYILLLVSLIGAIYPALDLGVGEKERGTLETLLLTPVPRSMLVLAKFLVLFTTSLLAVFLTLASMGLFVFAGVGLLASQGFDTSVLTRLVDGIGFTELVLILLLLAPASAIFAALLLTVSFYARNYKEAQNYISPLTFVAVLPVLISVLPGVSLNWTWAMVPLTNVALAIKELVKGTMDYPMIAAIFASSTLLAAIFLSITVIAFHRESVLFRT